MATLKRIPAGPAQLRPRDLNAATCRTDKAALAQRARFAGSSFFWPMLLLPAPHRNAMYAFYAFCREVHGATCGGAARTGKLALLADWRAEIALLFAGRPQHTVTQALGDPVSRFDLRFEDFLLILDGMEMEVRSDIRAPSLAQLDLYCERAVVPVGRIALRIFGTATPDADRVAASLGRALQLTGILRDLAQDATRQHLCLPRELLHAHGIFATMPSYVLAQPALPQVCNILGERAATHFDEAERAIAACPPFPIWAAAAILSTCRTLLEALLARGWTWLDEPVRIPAWRRTELLRLAEPDRQAFRAKRTHRHQPPVWPTQRRPSPSGSLLTD
jgi:presqualene diphosphate synthase